MNTIKDFIAYNILKDYLFKYQGQLSSSIFRWEDVAGSKKHMSKVGWLYSARLSFQIPSIDKLSWTIFPIYCLCLAASITSRTIELNITSVRDPITTLFLLSVIILSCLFLIYTIYLITTRILNMIRFIPHFIDLINLKKPGAIQMSIIYYTKNILGLSLSIFILTRILIYTNFFDILQLVLFPGFMLSLITYYLKSESFPIINYNINHVPLWLIILGLLMLFIINILTPLYFLSKVDYLESWFNRFQDSYNSYKQNFIVLNIDDDSPNASGPSIPKISLNTIIENSSIVVENNNGVTHAIESQVHINTTPSNIPSLDETKLALYYQNKVFNTREIKSYINYNLGLEMKYSGPSLRQQALSSLGEKTVAVSNMNCKDWHRVNIENINKYIYK